MQVIEKIKNALKTNQFIRILIELILVVGLFNVHQILGCIFSLIILLEIIIAKDNRNLVYIFIFLSFFDEVLIIDAIQGSISRIVMIVMFIKMLTIIIKNKIMPNKYQIGLISFFLISFLVGIFIVGFNINTLFILFNIVIFVCLSMILKMKDIQEVDSFIERLCITIIVAVSCSILYGAMNNKFLTETSGNDIIQRFQGTYEPNFMGMYINLAILSVLTIKERFPKKILAYLLLIVFICAIIATASVTGIIVLISSTILYFILQEKNWKEKVIDLLLIIGVIVIVFLGIKLVKTTETENNKQYNSGLETRVDYLDDLVQNGQFDQLTSGRIPLFKTFLSKSFDRPVINILLGNDATTKKIYCDFFGRERYSHNSYIDCLYNFGIIGFLLIIGFIGHRTIKNIYLNCDITKSKYSKNIKIIRIMLLIYALALSLYTKRMFLVFFLL